MEEYLKPEKKNVDFCFYAKIALKILIDPSFAYCLKHKNDRVLFVMYPKMFSAMERWMLSVRTFHQVRSKNHIGKES